MYFKRLTLYLPPMNSFIRKITIICLALIVGHSAIGQTQVSEAQMEADSLFDARKYTESFKLYEQMLIQERKSSPAMLLRMAFIKEGLGNVTDALYYLNLYYLHTADKRVLAKMDELAKKKGLEGYEFSDWEFIQTIFYKYFFHIVLTLLSIAFLLLATTGYLKYRKKQQPTFSAISMMFVLAVLFYTLNYGKNYSKSLVNSNNTYIMSGPSAGAEVVSIIDKGHRVEVAEKKDVWVKIEWKGQPGFVKQSKLKPITF